MMSTLYGISFAVILAHASAMKAIASSWNAREHQIVRMVENENNG